MFLLNFHLNYLNYQVLHLLIFYYYYYNVGQLIMFLSLLDTTSHHPINMF